MTLKEQFDKVLDFVRAAGATKAVIAGGACRDMHLQKPIKDIDVFYNGDLDEELIKQLFPIDETLDDLFGAVVFNAYEDNGWNVTHPALWLDDVYYPIQLIKVEGEIIDHIFTFGCTISQCWYEKDQVEVSASGYVDMINQKLVWVGDCGEAYKTKMKHKYHDWKWEGKAIPVPKTVKFLNRAAV